MYKDGDKIRRGQIDALCDYVQVVDIDNGLLKQVSFDDIFCYPENWPEVTTAIICMLPLCFKDGLDGENLGQSDKLNPEKTDSFVRV